VTADAPRPPAATTAAPLASTRPFRPTRHQPHQSTRQTTVRRDERAETNDQRPGPREDTARRRGAEATGNPVTADQPPATPTHPAAAARGLLPFSFTDHGPPVVTHVRIGTTPAPLAPDPTLPGVGPARTRPPPPRRSRAAQQRHGSTRRHGREPVRHCPVPVARGSAVGGGRPRSAEPLPRPGAAARGRGGPATPVASPSGPTGSRHRRHRPPRRRTPRPHPGPRSPTPARRSRPGSPR